MNFYATCSALPKGEDPTSSVFFEIVKTPVSLLTQVKYRLPSEVEQEYACRAGTTGRFYFGDDLKYLEDYAWFNKNSGVKALFFGGSSQPVGQKKPNQWGPYDMHGNVWKWCENTWHENYRGAPTDGTAWDQDGDDKRILRGGSWGDGPRFCRGALRDWLDPDDQDDDIGFRVACRFPRSQCPFILFFFFLCPPPVGSRFFVPNLHFLTKFF